VKNQKSAKAGLATGGEILAAFKVNEHIILLDCSHNPLLHIQHAQLSRLVELGDVWQETASAPCI